MEMTTFYLLAKAPDGSWYIEKAEAADQADMRNRVIPAMIQAGRFAGLQAANVEIVGETGDTQQAADNIKRRMRDQTDNRFETAFDRGMGNFAWLTGMGEENVFRTDATQAELGAITETTRSEAEAGSPRAVFQNFLRQRFGTGGALPAGLSRMEGYDRAIEQLGGLTQAFQGGESYLDQRQFLGDMADAAERQGIGFGRQMGVAGANVLADLAGGSQAIQNIFAAPESPGDAEAIAIKNLAALGLRGRMGGLGAEHWGGAITENAAEEYSRNIAAGLPQGSFAAYMNERTRRPGPVDYSAMFNI